jgi:hypothetical protein
LRKQFRRAMTERRRDGSKRVGDRFPSLKEDAANNALEDSPLADI